MDTEEKASVILRLPSTLSTYSGGKSQIALEAATFDELLQILKQQHSSVYNQLCTDQGDLRENVKIFASNVVISGSDNRDMELVTGQELIVLTTNAHP